MNVVPDYGGAAADGNFKKGRWILPLILLLAAGGIAVALFFVFKKEKERMKPEDAAKTKQDIFLKPRKEQVPEWRKWASSGEPLIAQEALIQLGLLDDPEAVKIAAEALKQNDHMINGVAAQVLAHFGSPAGDAGKAPLEAALKTADDSDKPHIVWALVKLKDATVFDTAMDLYRKKALTSVERLGGGKDFDPKLLAQLTTLDDFSAKYAADKDAFIRQLVATCLSDDGSAKYAQTLATLLGDSDPDVRRESAVGLGKMSDPAAREPLLAALKKSDDSGRAAFLTALQNGVGGTGLVLALQSVDHTKPDTEWAQYKIIFDMLGRLSDPRAADELVKWVDSAKPSPHWVYMAGLRLSEWGDIRGAKYLGQHLLLEPKDIYTKEHIWESGPTGFLSENDDERIVASRTLADLAAIHPDKASDLLGYANEGLTKWTKGRLQPSAGALRFWANLKAPDALKDMRIWAFPKDPIPKLGEVGHYPESYGTAQSALRYIGAYQDKDSYSKVLDVLKVKDTLKGGKEADLTEEGLKNGGASVTGMVVRGIQEGAADGLSEYGDVKSAKPLMEFIENDKLHYDARRAGCSALAFSSDDAIIKDVAERAVKFAADKDDKKQFIASCYAITLAESAHAQDVNALIDFLKPDMDLPIQSALAIAIGNNPLDEAAVAKLREKLKDEGTRNAAAVALLLGGDQDVAAETVAYFGTLSKEAVDNLKNDYFKAFGFWSDLDLKRNNLFRWVDNAESIAIVRIGGAGQHWAIERLTDQFDNLVYDNGPHSQTRSVLRYALMDMARKGDDKTKAEAIRTLKFMKEQGSLMALSDEQGLTGELARKAFHEFMNPVAVEKPEDVTKLQEEQAKKMRPQEAGGPKK